MVGFLKILFWAILAAAVLWLFAMRCRRHLRRMPLLIQYRYAHRGLHGGAVPENSLEAFRLASAMGFAAELDVHLTRDGRLAVIHDQDLRRLCGVEGAVEEQTVQELSHLRLCGTGHRIPMLEEVLPLFEGRQPLLIELKDRRNSAQLVDAFCAAMKGFHGDFAVESFNPWVLYLLRLRRPDYIRGQLSKDFLKDRSIPPIAGFFLKNLCFNWLAKPDFIAYRYQDRRNLGLRLCRRLYGVQEFSWTVTTPEEQTAAEQDGSVIIFESFRPDL